MSLPQPQDIPIFPRPLALARLITMTPEADTQDYIGVVSGDPAMTAHLLRLANSAAAPSLTPITSVHEAVVRLGTENVRRALSVMLLRQAFDGVQRTRLDVQALWWHIVGTALLAEAICSHDLVQARTAFTAGLMHDIGRISLAMMNPVRYEAAVRRAREGRDIVSAERLEFGTSHITWGEHIARNWKLPQEIVEAIGGHHDAEEGIAGAVVQARGMLATLGMSDGLPLEFPAPAESDEPPLLTAFFGGREAFTERLKHYGEPREAPAA